MAGAPTLMDRYTDIFDDLVRESARFTEFSQNPDEHVKNVIFQLLNTRVLRLMKEVDCTNAPLMMRSLINLMPIENETNESFIERMVEYHDAEKIVIRKYKHKTGYESKELKLEEFFKFMIARIRNKADSHGIE